MSLIFRRFYAADVDPRHFGESNERRASRRAVAGADIPRKMNVLVGQGERKINV
jgi:hypothetical protein